MTKRLRVIQFKIEPVIVAVDSDSLQPEFIEAAPIIVAGDQIDGFAAEFAEQLAQEEAKLNAESAL